MLVADTTSDAEPQTCIQTHENKLHSRPTKNGFNSGPRLALLFSYENLGSTAREFLHKCETLRCENCMLAIICPLLLVNGIDVAILWAGLAKRSKENSCSQNLLAAHDFYDARRTFYASSYENLVEKSARHASGFLNQAILTQYNICTNTHTHTVLV